MAIRKVSNRIARFSAYSHVEDHLREKTVTGGIVTLCALLCALYLVLSESVRCLKVNVKREMVVDGLRKPSVHIEFNLTFPSLPCRAIRVAAGDSSGHFETESVMEQVHDGEVHKWMLDKDGRHLEKQEFIRARGSDNPFMIMLDYDDMKAVREEIKSHYGCNIYGWVNVSRVAGNLHFAVRQEAVLAAEDDITTMDALLRRHAELFGAASPDHPDTLLLNASHIIHTFRFGTLFPNHHYPLEGVRRVDRKATGIDKYFLKVVPVTHRSLWGYETHGEEYSVTEYYSRLDPVQKQPPGILFLYDFWPIRVKYILFRIGFLHLLVKLCAVCGGIWTVAGIVDRGSHKLAKTVHRLLQGRGMGPISSVSGKMATQ